jgi:hypothetical protein
MAGQNLVVLGGQQYSVPSPVADAIRSHPADFRGGAVGPDAFPDIPGGQGNIHPDTRTNNGNSTTVDYSAGHSFTWEWLRHIYTTAWSAYSSCSGCDAAKRDLAFAYGYLVHAAGDVWGHTFINNFAGGTFPSVADLGIPSQLKIALRHTVVEGYVDRHVPAGTSLTIDAPTDFLYSTFIDNATAASYGRGVVIDKFLQVKEKLVQKRNDLTAYIDSGIWPGCSNPVAWLSCAERSYVNAWIDDIDRGLRAYPTLSLNLARDLFTNSGDGVAQAKADVGAYVNNHLLSMIGLPDFVGWWANLTDAAVDGLRAIAAPILEPIEAMKDQFYNWLVKQATGQTLDEWASYFKSPETHINSASIGLPTDTGAKVDRFMGLPGSGLYNTQALSPTGFAAVANTITLGKLALLDGPGLNSVLQARGVAQHYYATSGIADNVMIPLTRLVRDRDYRAGWARSIDGDHQWMKISPRDGHQYGEGTFFLWQDCASRPKVFRALFADWENTLNFPNDDGNVCASASLPTAITGGATNITTDAAIVAGTLNPQSYPTSYRFDYGTTGAYGASTAVRDAGTGTSSVQVSAQLSGLTPNTTYHYRVVALRSGALAAAGADQTFTTNVLSQPGGDSTSSINSEVRAPDFAPPKLKALQLSPMRFKATKSGPSLVLSGNRGTRVSFVSDEEATVTLTIERAQPGRQLNGRCQTETGKNRKAKRCTRYIMVKGNIQWNATAGTNRFRFTGRINGRTLSHGSYRLVATARDLSGNLATPVLVTFTIK